MRLIVVSPKASSGLRYASKPPSLVIRATLELQLDPALEGNSEDGLLGFTGHIRHPAPARQPLCR
jgi:hypothetical protein